MAHSRRLYLVQRGNGEQRYLPIQAIVLIVAEWLRAWETLKLRCAGGREFNPRGNIVIG